MKLLILLVCSMASGATSAAVYKCKSGDRIVYSDVPCPNAVPVDTTNGKRPPLGDVLDAYSRNLTDIRKVRALEASVEREKRMQQLCNGMARDHASRQQNMMKYPKDAWWKNRVADSQDDLNTYCKGYLVP